MLAPPPSCRWLAYGLLHNAALPMCAVGVQPERMQTRDGGERSRSLRILELGLGAGVPYQRVEGEILWPAVQGYRNTPLTPKRLVAGEPLQ